MFILNISSYIKKDLLPSDQLLTCDVVLRRHVSNLVPVEHCDTGGGIHAAHERVASLAANVALLNCRKIVGVSEWCLGDKK